MRVSLFLSAVLLASLTAAVYQAKHRAGEARREIAALHARISQLDDEIHVLRAEEAHLTRPERIAALARTRLGLVAVEPDQFVDLAELGLDRGLALEAAR